MLSIEQGVNKITFSTTTAAIVLVPLLCGGHIVLVFNYLALFNLLPPPLLLCDIPLQDDKNNVYFFFFCVFLCLCFGCACMSPVGV